MLRGRASSWTGQCVTLAAENKGLIVHSCSEHERRCLPATGQESYGFLIRRREHHENYDSPPNRVFGSRGGRF